MFQFIDFYFWRNSPSGPCSPHYRGIQITLRNTTLGRTPLDQRSDRHRDPYLTTHKSHKRQTSMFPLGIESTVSAGERRQTYALDRAATGIG